MEKEQSKRCQLPQSVYEVLQRDILAFKYKPGEVIKERAIAARLNVSRTPVREALHKLEAEGLVKHYPNMGMIVTELTIRDVIEAFQLRELIEPAAAGIAAKVLQKEELREMARMFDEYSEPESKRDEVTLEKYNELDARLHELIVASVGNSKMMDAIKNLRNTCTRACWFGVQARFAVSVTEHKALINALMAGESDLAETLMREHLQNTRRDLVLLI